MYLVVYDSLLLLLSVLFLLNGLLLLLLLLFIHCILEFVVMFHVVLLVYLFFFFFSFLEHKTNYIAYLYCQLSNYVLWFIQIFCLLDNPEISEYLDIN